MAALLLLDLDNTLADRERAFLAWAQAKMRDWAPGDPDAVAYLVEQDADGMRARDEFFSALAARFGVRRPVLALIGESCAQRRRRRAAALPPVDDDVFERLGELRAGGWKIAVVTRSTTSGSRHCWMRAASRAPSGLQTGQAHLPDRRRTLRHSAEQRVDDRRWGSRHRRRRPGRHSQHLAAPRPSVATSRRAARPRRRQPRRGAIGIDESDLIADYRRGTKSGAAGQASHASRESAGL